jgi:hypothetical protein
MHCQSINETGRRLFDAGSRIVKISSANETAGES